MTNIEHFSYPGWATIFRALSVAGGRYEAFQFVMQCKGDVIAIQTEIQEREELIATLIDRPMKAGTTTRAYRDAYIATLKESLQIIQNSQ